MEGQVATMERTPSTPSHWTSAQGVAWIKQLVAEKRIEPCRALVLSADLVEEAIALSQAGCHTIMVDTDMNALQRAKKQGGSAGANIDTIEGDVFTKGPSFFGPVNLIYDRTLFHRLDPVQRSDWTHLMGRILPSDGLLLGLFLVGRGGSGPPYPVSLEAHRKSLRRLFVEEHLTPQETVVPGRDQAYGALFHRK